MALQSACKPEQNRQHCLLECLGQTQPNVPYLPLQALIQDVLEPSGRMRAYTIAQSWPLANLLGPAARACINAGNREGCNAVANLCALQMYSS